MIMNMDFKIDGIDDFIEGLDPDVYREVLNVTANERVYSALTQTFPKMKKRFNMNIKRQKPGYWKVTSRYSKQSMSRGGYFKIFKISKDGKAGHIKISGTPIPATQFDTKPDSYSHPTITKVSKSGKRTTSQKRIAVKIRGRRQQILKNTSKRYVFRATMKSGHSGIFIRSKGEGGIFEETVITPVSMFDNKDVDFAKVFSDDWDKKAGDRFVHNLVQRQRWIWE